MKIQLLITYTLLMTSTAAIAAPSVTGNTISWPDDGWYQVQARTDNGIVEVCAGGRSCQVSPGNYIVINHSTNQRFENVEVSGRAISDDENGEGEVDEVEVDVNEVRVSGNTITWPDDGWYQVQAITSEGIIEVCAGTRSCEVTNGTYIVINHSTGKRTSPVVVDSNGSSEPTEPTSPTNDSDQTGVVVSSNTIRWPDDGWYQVQAVTDDGIIEVCGGGRSCEVPNGEYIVINHTTGERTEPVFVNSSNDISEPDTQAIVNATNWQEILRNAIALTNAERALMRHQSLLEQSRTLSNAVVIETIAGGTSNTLSDLGLTLLPLADPNNNREVEYSCSNGGTLMFFLSPGAPLYSTQADNCALNGDVYDGRFFNNSSGREGIFSLMENATVNMSNGSSFALSGEYSTFFDRVQFRRSATWSDASMSEQSGDLNHSVDSFSMHNRSEDGVSPGTPIVVVIYSNGAQDDARVYQHNANIEGSFNVTAPWTNNQAMSVSANLSFNEELLTTSSSFELPIPYETNDGRTVMPTSNLGQLPSQWTSGNIELVAADGSSITMRPNPDDRTSALVDISGMAEPQTVLLSDGYQIRCFGSLNRFEECL